MRRCFTTAARLLALALACATMLCSTANAGWLLCPKHGYQGYYMATPATGYFGTPYSYARPVGIFTPPYPAYGQYSIPGRYGDHCCPYNEDGRLGVPIRTHIRGTLMQ